MGVFLLMLTGAMAIPALADALAGNPDWGAYATSGAISGFTGGTLVLVFLSDRRPLSRSEAFVLTSLAWIVVCAFAALPFRFSVLALSYTDAYFETMAGLTTTGSTIIVGFGNFIRAVAAAP